MHDKALVSEIFAFYPLLESALGRPGRRDHVHLGNSKNDFRVLKIIEGFERFSSVFEGFKNFEGFKGIMRALRVNL